MLPLLPPAAHLGSLHPVEQALTLLLAFGPFAVLGLVLVLRRRQDARDPGPTDPLGSADAPGPQRER